jgi:hypothetical protein
MPRGRSKKKSTRRADPPVASRLPTLQWFADNGGQITFGSIPPLDCVAIAANEHGMIVALQRGSKESLAELIERLDTSLDHCLRNETFIDEINPT